MSAPDTHFAVPDASASPPEPPAGALVASASAPGVSDLDQGASDDGPAQADVQDAPEAMPIQADEEWWELTMAWAGKTYELKVGGNDLIFDFRTRIEQLTSVPADGQKLIGLVRGKLPPSADGERFSTLGLKKALKFTMVGTPADERVRAPPRAETDDFDVTYPTRPAREMAPHAHVAPMVQDGKTRYGVTPAEDPRNIRLVRQLVTHRKVDVMNPPREGKRLLVLDLDYTIVDTRPMIDGALPSVECARPGLHDFLASVYPYYDIVIWSQTKWTWLETKLVELGLVGEERPYKICFVADKKTMFPIIGFRDGESYHHEIKPLSFLWQQFPQWSAKNTIHIDDLARNFAMNPGEGLRIRAFKGAGTEQGAADAELFRLGPYLVNIATTCDDFTLLDHGKWKVRASEVMRAQAEERMQAVARPERMAADGEGVGSAVVIAPSEELGTSRDAEGLEGEAAVDEPLAVDEDGIQATAAATSEPTSATSEPADKGDADRAN
ncbi:hypothetical protein Q5752_002389 [Cryptotrichosporon argae]